MTEKLKQLKPIQNMMVLAFLVLLSILTTQTSAIAQHHALVPQTGQTQSYEPGDDGDLRMGVPWPNKRFTDNGDGTVKDNLTRLIWLKNAYCFGDELWEDALGVCNNLADGQCGLSDGSSPGDWRLPNVRELHSLIDFGNSDPALPSGHPFTGVWVGWYWTSTSPWGGAAQAVEMEYGFIWLDATDLSNGVWPVRGGKCKDKDN